MPVLRIPTPLRAYTNGQAEITVNGTSISEALTDLTNQYPTIKPHLFNDGGELRPFVNLFVGEHNIKDLQGVDTPIKDGEKIMLIPSIAGGSSLRGAYLLFATKQSRSTALGLLRTEERRPRNTCAVRRQCGVTEYKVK